MTPAESTDVAAAVDFSLKLAGLSLSLEDRQWLERIYPLVRGQARGLRLPEVRYAEMAVVYPP